MNGQIISTLLHFHPNIYKYGLCVHPPTHFCRTLVFSLNQEHDLAFSPHDSELSWFRGGQQLFEHYFHSFSFLQTSELSVSSHQCPSETFPHWPAAPVRWLFLEGRMFKLAADSDSCFFAGDAEEEPVPVTGYTHTHTSQAALTRRLQECSTHLWASFYRQHKDQTCKRNTTKTPTFRLKRVGENIRNTCIPSTYTTGYKKE